MTKQAETGITKTPMQNNMNRRTFLLPLIAAGMAPLSTSFVSAQEQAAAPAGRRGRGFTAAADEALAAMVKRAGELKIKGVALVASTEGDTVTSWSSKMKVVGSMTNAPSQKDHGSNLLAIAYAKAAEMADTLKDSGSAGRPPMTGETGWQGGLIAKGKNGYLIAAFSGGPSEDDLRVSRAGLDVLTGRL